MWLHAIQVCQNLVNYGLKYYFGGENLPTNVLWTGLKSLAKTSDPPPLKGGKKKKLEHGTSVGLFHHVASPMLKSG